MEFAQSHPGGRALCHVSARIAVAEGQQMAAAFRGGILVLLAAPFSLVGVVATLIVRMQRRRLRLPPLDHA